MTKANRTGKSQQTNAAKPDEKPPRVVRVVNGMPITLAGLRCMGDQDGSPRERR